MAREKRILYVQYTNPGAYPPLEHSSRILAEAGWSVRFFGTGAYGAADSLVFPPHPDIVVRLWRFQSPGWRQKLHYLWFVACCVANCVAWRPKVVYCSDPWSTPIGVLVWYLLRIPVIYHEHDAPASPKNLVLRLVSAARRRLARVAAACVIPQRERLRQFEAELRPRLALCVWNCPRREEVATLNGHHAAKGLNLFYVGSLNSSLLPETTVRVLSFIVFVDLK
ncbi:MAG: glycosyltransferase, partial [Pirellulales bacterium]